MSVSRVTCVPNGRQAARAAPVVVAGLLSAALCCAASVASAQLLRFNVTGASEETRAFDTLYQSAPGLSPAWRIQGKLLVVYRVSAPSGTVTLDVTLLANTNPRLASGGSQVIALYRAWSNNLIDAAEGPPGEALTVSHSFPYDTTGVARQAFLVSTGSFPGTCGISGGCSNIHIYVVVLLRPATQLTLLGGPAFPLVLGPPAPTFLQMSLLGVNPLTDVTDVAIDGESLRRVPSGVVPLNQSPGAGSWDRIPDDPLPPDDVHFPGSISMPDSVEDFLGCGGGGCGSPGLRLGMPATLGPGLHTLRVSGIPYAGIVYTLYGQPATYGLVGGASLTADEEFILLDPKLRVSPSQAEAGSTITVSGTGFAPNGNIPLSLSVHCCGSRVALAIADSDLTGAFSLQVALPAVNAPPFSSTWSSSAPPGATAAGVILADVGDAAFVAAHGPRGGPYSAPITFVKPGATPTTTTTLPPPACAGDAECDDGDPCTQDSCPAGACVHTPLAGAANVQCTLPPTGLRPPACTNETVPRRTERQYRKATGFIDRAVRRTGGAVRRLLKKADKALKRGENAVLVANLAGQLSDGCAQGITDVIDAVRDRIRPVLDER